MESFDEKKVNKKDFHFCCHLNFNGRLWNSNLDLNPYSKEVPIDSFTETHLLLQLLGI